MTSAGPNTGLTFSALLIGGAILLPIVSAITAFSIKWAVAIATRTKISLRALPYVVAFATKTVFVIPVVLGLWMLATEGSSVIPLVSSLASITICTVALAIHVGVFFLMIRKAVGKECAGVARPLLVILTASVFDLLFGGLIALLFVVAAPVLRPVSWWVMNLGSPGSIHSVDSFFLYPANPIPIWAVILIVLVGLVAAGVNLLPQNIMPIHTRVALLYARLLGFAILLVLICQLEVRLTVPPAEVRPKIVVLTDTSGSMGVKDVDGDARLTAARKFFDDNVAKLKTKAEVTVIDFNWQLQTSDRIAAMSHPAGDESTTTRPSAIYDPATPAGMTRLIGSIRDAVQRERDLQGVIVLTDGNDTAGDSGALLASALKGRKLPVFPVVFGQTAEPKMATVKISSATPYVRFGDEFRLNATLSVSHIGEQIVGVNVYEEGIADPVDSRQNIRVGKDPVDIAFVIKPRSVGLKAYRVIMDGVRDSNVTGQLVAEQTVEVIDSPVKVLYLDIPRDERKILGTWLARDPIVSLAMLTMLPMSGWYAQGVMLHKNAGDGLPDKEEDLYKYDIIILGDIPRSYFKGNGDLTEAKMQRIAEFVARRGGGLITLGGRSVYAAGQYDDSPLSHILPFDLTPPKDTQLNKPPNATATGGGGEDSEPMQVRKPFSITPTGAGLAHPLMMLEPDPVANREAWQDLPTLDGNNIVGNVKPGASLLAVRKLDSGGTMPIIAIQPVGKGQVLSLSADTTWRWEMMRPDKGEDYYRRFWGNAIRTLAPDPRLSPNRPQITRYDTNTPLGTTVTLSTRLVDAVFKPLSKADLDVQVTSPSGKISHIYPRDGREAPGLYEYQVTLDEPGAWNVAARFNKLVSEERHCRRQ